MAERVRLVEGREIGAGAWWQTWSAPRIARSVLPGQFVHLVAPRSPGLLLPVLPVAGFDRVAGTIELLPTGSARRLLGSLRVGDDATLEGPLGRGFAIDPRSRYLLVAAEAGAFARVRAIVDEAVGGGRQVTVLVGAETVADVLPSTLLPDEAEYVVATADGSLGHRGSLAELIPQYEAWADQCFAAGPAPLLARLVGLAGGRDARMGVARLGRRRGRRPARRGPEARHRAWLQVALPHDDGCALAVCAGCVVDGAEGPVRTCREGPAFATGELRWEPLA